MIGWWALVTLSAAALPWTGATLTQGSAAVQLSLAPAADTVAVTLFWPEYDKITIEGTLPFEEGCRASIFDAIRARVDGACRSVDGRLPDRHPLYDYTSSTRVRCVFGEGSSPAWCRLSYTGWFEVSSYPLAPDVTEAARTKLLALIAEAPDAVEQPAGEARWFSEITWDGLELVPTGQGPLEGPTASAHALYLDAAGRPILHCVGDRVVDRIVWDAQGRARTRETFGPSALDSVRWLHIDRGTPAVLAVGSREHIYLLKPLR